MSEVLDSLYKLRDDSMGEAATLREQIAESTKRIVELEQIALKAQKSAELLAASDLFNESAPTPKQIFADKIATMGVKSFRVEDVDEVVTLDPWAGSSIWDAIQEAVTIREKLGKTIRFTFNDKEFTVTKDTTVKDLEKKWNAR